MKVFVSWSKPLSHEVAKSFASWLPKVIQECREPFVSSDTAKGEAWFQAITEQLKASKVGVVFITAENRHEEWIHLEAGAMYASFGKSLCPVLVGIRKADYDGPLSNLQLTEAEDRDDMLLLMRTINDVLETPLPASTLEESFDAWWPKLQAQLTQAIASSSSRDATPERPMEAKIDEILLVVREFARQTVPEPSSHSNEWLKMLSNYTHQHDDTTERKLRVEAFAKTFGGQFVREGDDVVGTIIDVKQTPLSSGVSKVEALVRWADGRPAEWLSPSTLTLSDVPF
ncbi:TIR domain-containing protein [Plantibacter sp. CFBP 13570]|uniref:TIR domain-containing protein n=1 Tax=Plantibacter sp. CFBP 13570 TaxID=2775272 RepID=UPI001930DAC8|nr:TIR domain-containing protein [Plantibacter sp. CFBP 13570]MBD8535680.1 TIR domain-containing protein [Plantibacter sp. CFBP 13570]